MSHDYYHRSSLDDYKSSQGMYSDSYQSESDCYRPRDQPASQESMTSAASSSRLMGNSEKAVSFLKSCGLDASDLPLLAEFPDHMITVETLPKLLLQLKERKLCSNSSPWSSTTQSGTSTSSTAWKSSTNVKVVEYPLDFMARSSYPLPPEQIQSWQDRWGNPRKMVPETSSVTGDTLSTVVDNNYSKDVNPYYDEQLYTSAALEKSSVGSHSYADYSSGSWQHQPSHFISEEPIFKVPTRKEASDFHCISPPVFPYACILCNFTVLTEVDWSVHIKTAQHSCSRLKLLEKYPEWDQNLESAKRTESQTTLQGRSTKRRDSFQNVPKRKEACDFQGRIPPTFPYTCSLCDFSIFSEQDWCLHIRSALHSKCQLQLVEKYPGWDQTIESARRIEMTPQTKPSELRAQSDYTVPTRKEASDFLCKVPPVFPYACVLCNITAFSEKDWLLHTSGPQHANSQVQLLEKYPKWNQCIASARRNESRVMPQNKFTDTRGQTKPKNQENSALDLAKTFSSKTTVKDTSRVVSVTFAANTVDDGYLKKQLGQFGTIVKVLMFPRMALVEMATKDQLMDIIKYFAEKPLMIKGTWVEFSVATTFSFLQSPCVISFSPLPTGDDTTSELMTVAESFGPIKSLCLSTWGYVEMTNSEDAKKLVEHYSAKPLKLKKETVQVSLSTEYGTLLDSDIQGQIQRRERFRPKRHSSQRDSPSPKRRCSAEKTPSSRSSRSKDRDNRRRSSETRSRERSKTSSKNSQDSTKHSDKDKTTKSSEGSEIKRSISGASVDSDSDLEGLEVIADDGEQLQHDDDFEPSDEQEMDQEGKTRKADTPTPKEEQNTSAANVDVTHHASHSQDNSSLGSLDIPHTNTEENHDHIYSLENCITLDDLNAEGETFSDLQESNEQKPPAQKTEETLDEVAKTINHESIQQSESIKEENIHHPVTEPNHSEEKTVNITDDQSTEQQEEEKDTKYIEEIFGKVLVIRNLPNSEDYTDLDLMNIAKRYGEVKHYVLFHDCKKGFLEMVHASDAERIASDSENQDIALRGNVLKMKVSEKYSSLPVEGINVDGDSDEEESSKIANSEKSTDNDQNAAGAEKPNEPVGTEFVCPVVGYFCNLCKLFYASEKEAKDEHCKSASHREKLKEHKEKSVSA